MDGLSLFILLFYGSSKDAELLREGPHVEKVCNTTKHVPGSTELAKDMGLSSGEANAPNSLTPLGSDWQMKMETNNAPSSVNAAKDSVIKFGKYHSGLN